MKIYAYSKALYATWFYLEPWRLLFDAGEGLNGHLEGRLLAFRDLAITHAHTDHFTGVHNILVTRLREMEMTGEEIPKLHITFPADSHSLLDYFDYLRKALKQWDQLVELQPVMPGDTVTLRGARGLTMTVHKADHYVYKQSALAYSIAQERRVLRPEFEGKPQREINQFVAQHGRDAVTVEVMKPLLHYSGDGRVQLDHHVEGWPLLIQECTFLEEVGKASHASIGDVVSLFREVKPAFMLLFHLSTRYEFREYLEALDRLVPEPELRERIFAIRPGSVMVKDFQIPGF